MEIRDIVAALASGHIIRTDDLGGYDGYEYRLVPEAQAPLLTTFQISRLIREGWLDSFNGGFRLSDEGRKAYMRSTDEMGGGELVPPSREGSGQ